MDCMKLRSDYKEYLSTCNPVTEFEAWCKVYSPIDTLAKECLDTLAIRIFKGEDHEYIRDMGHRAFSMLLDRIYKHATGADIINAARVINARLDYVTGTARSATAMAATHALMPHCARFRDVITHGDAEGYDQYVKLSRLHIVPKPVDIVVQAFVAGYSTFCYNTAEWDVNGTMHYAVLLDVKFMQQKLCIEMSQDMYDLVTSADAKKYTGDRGVNMVIWTV